MPKKAARKHFVADEEAKEPFPVRGFMFLDR
jgi:hypothetical protein